MRKPRTLSKDIPTWWRSCKGNRFQCIKFRQQWFASLPDKKRKTVQEKYG